MDSITFEREDKKYSDLWQNGYKDANWKRLAKAVLSRVNPNQGLSLIDFGFGRGTALDFFESNGFYVEGIEISSYTVETQRQKGITVYNASLDDLHMLKNNQFNIGFCNDVIEHVPENLIFASLDEMVRVCSDNLFISICPTPSNHLSLDGKNLHLTVKPESWWEQQLRNYGKVERLRFWFNRSLRYIIDLKSKPSYN